MAFDVNVSLYQAASALDANSRWQEVIADNLASGSVPGYKQQQLSLSAMRAGLMSANGEKNQPQYFTVPQSHDLDQFLARGNEIYRWQDGRGHRRQRIL